MDEATLARYQRALLSSLRDGDDPARVRARLSADPELAPLADYIASLDDDALRVARQLVAKWARPGAEA